MKAGILLPWKEDPEDGSDDCSLAPGASSASLVLLCLSGVSGDRVNNTQMRLLPVPLKAAGADARLTPRNGDPGPRSSGGSRYGDRRGQPVTGLWEQRWQLLGLGQFTHPSFALGPGEGVSRQGSLQSAFRP